MYTNPSVTVPNMAAQQRASQEIQQLQQLFANKLPFPNSNQNVFNANTQSGLPITPLQQQQTLLQQTLLHSSGGGMQASNLGGPTQLNRYPQMAPLLPNPTFAPFSSMGGMDAVYGANSSFSMLSNSLREGASSSNVVQQTALPPATHSLTELQEFFVDNANYMHPRDGNLSSGFTQQQAMKTAVMNVEGTAGTSRVLLFIEQPQSPFQFVEEDLCAILNLYASVKTVIILKDRPAAEVEFGNAAAVEDARKDLDNLPLPAIGILRCIPLKAGKSGSSIVPAHSSQGMNPSAVPSIMGKAGFSGHINERIPEGNEMYDKLRSGDVPQKKKEGGVLKKICWLEIMDIFGYEPDFDVTKLLLGQGDANIEYIMRAVNQKIDLSIQGKPVNEAPPDERLHVVIVSEDLEAYRQAVDLVEDLIRNIIVQFFDFASEYGYNVPDGIIFRRHEYNEASDGNMAYLGVVASPRICGDEANKQPPPASMQQHLPPQHPLPHAPSPQVMGMHGRRSRSPTSHRRGSGVMGGGGRDRDRRGLGVVEGVGENMDNFKHVGPRPPHGGSNRGNSPRIGGNRRGGGDNVEGGAPRFHMNPRGVGPRVM